MTEQDEVLQLSPRHVKLSKWATVYSVVDSINEMYGEAIDPLDYEDRLTFTDEDGLFTIHLVEIASGKTRWVFKDRYTLERAAKETKTLVNPKAFPYPEVVRNFGIVINTERELEFLSDVRKDVIYNTSPITSDKSRRLADILNRYNYGDGWGSNPMDGNTTAYFKLRYFGPGSQAPDAYNFNRDAKLLVVVELLMHGVYKTHALFVG